MGTACASLGWYGSPGRKGRPSALVGAGLLALTTLLLLPGARAEGYTPLDTETAVLLAPGEVQVELGLAAAEGAHRVLVPEEDASSLVLPRLGLRTGLGRWGEIRVLGDVWTAFDTAADGTVHDAGDWWVRTKVRIGPAAGRVGWAAQAGFKIPVASDDDGIGTDEADVEILGLFTARPGRGRLDANLGVDILGAPTRDNFQQDLLRYGVAYWWRPDDPLSIGGEIVGRSAGDGFPALVMLRAGLRRGFGAWRLDAAVAAGLSDASPDLEIRAGATYRFRRGAP